MNAVNVANNTLAWFSMTPEQRKALLAPHVRKVATPEDEAAEAFESDKRELAKSPRFIAELGLTNEDSESIAEAMRDGDTLQVGCIVADALEREAQESIEIRADRDGLTLNEAAAQLVEVYS